MTTANIAAFPDALTRLAMSIKQGLVKVEASRSAAAKNREAWVDAWVDVAVRVCEAKTSVKNANIAFGQWWDAQAFNLNAQERAALVAMGKEPVEMRKAFNGGESWSIELIYKNRFESALKTTGKRSRKPTPAPGEEQHQRSINLAPADWRTLGEIAEEESVSVAAKLGKLVREHIDPTPIERATLSKTAQQKLDAARRQMERKANAELAARMRGLDEEVRQRVLKDNAEYRATLEEYERKARDTKECYAELVNHHKPIFTPEDFRTILMCLHPDGAQSRSPAKLNEAFTLFNAKKLQLTKQR